MNRRTPKLIALAAIALALPAAGQAGSPYVGVQGGVSIGRDSDVDEFTSYSSSQIPTSPAAPSAPADIEFDDVLSVGYKTGSDFGLTAGYDFGMFRVELELARKKAQLEKLGPDENFDNFINSANAVLNRPSAPPDPGAPGHAALGVRDFDLSGDMVMRSAMVNGMVDAGVVDRISVYAGGGYGRSSARSLGDKDGAWAWQYFAGIRYSLSDRFEVGLKHIYFNSGILKLRHEGIHYAGNPDRLAIAAPGGTPTIVDQTTNLLLTPEIEGEIRSRSFLATFSYNF
jgi:opacity protein-like surface antigen